MDEFTFRWLLVVALSRVTSVAEMEDYGVFPVLPSVNRGNLTLGQKEIWRRVQERINDAVAECGNHPLSDEYAKDHYETALASAGEAILGYLWGKYTGAAEYEVVFYYLRTIRRGRIS